VPSHPEQVCFPAGQVTFYFHLPNVQGPWQVAFHPNQKGKLRLAQGKQNLRAAHAKGKLKFKLF